MNKDKADIKLAYQTAAELTFLVAVGLNQARQSQKLEKFLAKDRNKSRD